MKTLFIALILAIISSINCDKFNSTDKWAEFKDSGYTVRNNVFGSGAGTQQLHANSYHEWGIHANHPNTSVVKAYAYVGKDIRLSEINSLKSDFTVYVPKSGVYTTAYKIDCYGVVLGDIMSTFDITLIMNQHGIDAPKPSIPNMVKVGDHTWGVHKDSENFRHVITFNLIGDDYNSYSGTINVKAIIDWIRREGWFGETEGLTISELKFGFEVISADGLDFNVTNFSVESSGTKIL